MKACVVERLSFTLLLSSVFVLLPVSLATGGLVAHWRLDGDFSDSTGNYDGVFSGTGSPWVIGALGQALNLQSGSSWYHQYVDTGLSLSDGPKTMVFYVSTNDYTSQACWAGNQADPSHRFYFGTMNDRAFGGAGTSYPSGDWNDTTTSVFNHYAFVDYGSDVKLVSGYQNGQAVFANTAYSGSTATATGNDFEIGRAGGSGNAYANAVLDDVAVFDTALEGADIAYIAIHGVQDYADMINNVVYRETFPHDGDPYLNRTIPTEGWKAHRGGGEASSDTAIAREPGANPLPAMNSSPEDTGGNSTTNGYVFQPTAGTDYLYWTDEYSIGNVNDIEMVRWYQRNSASSDIFRVALRLDAGIEGDPADDQWFVSSDEFTNETGVGIFTNSQPNVWYLNELSVHGALWYGLDFSEDSTLELASGSEGNLPSGLAVTAFGLYSPNVSNSQRFDDFEIRIPEPGTFVLLVLGVIGIVWRRQSSHRR